MAHSVEFKIGADVTEFEKGIKSSEKDVKSLEKTASWIQKGLKVKFDASSFAEAQAKLQTALKETNETITAVKEKMSSFSKSGKVDTSGYKKLQVDLAKAETEAKKLRKRIDQVNGAKLDSVISGIKTLGSSITAVGETLTVWSAAAAAALAAAYKLSTSAALAADGIKTLSSEYSLSAQEVQKWTYVAEQSGITSDDMMKSMQKLKNAMGEITIGESDKATKALQSMGLSMDSFKGDTDAAMTAVIESLGKMGDQTKATALATDIFGDELGSKVVAVSSQGSDAIQSLIDEYGSMESITDESIETLNGLSEAFKAFKTKIEDAAYNLAAKLAPALEKIMGEIEDSLIPLMDKIGNYLSSLSDSQVETIIKILAVVAAIGPLVLGIGKIVTGIGSAIKAFSSLGGAFSALAANPIVLIIAAIAAALVLCYKSSESFRTSISGLFSAIGSLLSPIMSSIEKLASAISGDLEPVFEAIGDILSPIIDMVSSLLSLVMSALSPILESLEPLLEFAVEIDSSILQFYMSLLKPIVSFISSALIPIIEKFASMVSDVFGTIRGWIVTGLNWLIDRYNDVINWLNGVIKGINGVFGTNFSALETKSEISVSESKGTESAAKGAASSTSNEVTTSNTSNTTNNTTNDNSTTSVSVNVSVNSLDSGGMSLDDLADEIGEKSANAINRKLAGEM